MNVSLAVCGVQILSNAPAGLRGPHEARHADQTPSNHRSDSLKLSIETFM